MSKRKSNESEGFYEFFKSTFKIEGEGGIFDEDDDDDEDYNLIEDMMTNNKNYRYDKLPYNFTIPKKEVDDIINDPDFLTFSPEDNSGLTSKSNARKKGIHLNKHSKKRKEKEIEKQEVEDEEKTKKNNMISPSQTKHFKLPQTAYPNYTDINTIMAQRQNGVIKPLNMEFSEAAKFLLKQFEIYLQLLLQNFLLCKDPNLKLRAYTLIYNFFLERTKIINVYNLPKFEVGFSFCRIFNEGKKLSISPQISFFQSPILEILPILIPLSEKNFTKDQVSSLLKEFIPFINTSFLPLGLKFCKNKMIVDEKMNFNETENAMFEVRSENENLSKNEQFLGKKKKKFGHLHDYLLTIGLQLHGKKKIDVIQKFWLENRTIQEIKHRLKNLTCLKAPENIVKKLKNKMESFLSKDEFYMFLKGIQWFGTRRKWSVISRYFLPKRSPEYLEELYRLMNEQGILQLEDKERDKDKSRKKSEFKQSNKIKGEDQLFKTSLDFKAELDSTPKEIHNLASKDFFPTVEKGYDKVIFDEETSDSEEEKHKRRKGLVDIHIKNAKKLSFERIVLDN